MDWEPLDDFYGKGESFEYFEKHTRDRIIHDNEEEILFPPNPYALANAKAGPSVEIKSVEEVLDDKKKPENIVQYSLRSTGIKSHKMGRIDSTKSIKQPLPEMDVDTFSGRPLILNRKYMKPVNNEKRKSSGKFNPEEVLRRYNDPNLSIEQKCRTLFNSPDNSLDQSKTTIEISDDVIEISDDSSQSLNSTDPIAYQRLISKSDKYIIDKLNSPFSSSSSSLSTNVTSEESSINRSSPQSQSSESPIRKNRKGRKQTYRKVELDFYDNEPNITPSGVESISRNQLFIQKARFN